MKESIKFYHVDEDYLNYLRKSDDKVSLKDTRSFIGVLINFNKKKYCIPLTSKVLTSSGKKRNGQITTFVKDESDEKIACLLYNNMIPVFDELLTEIKFDDLSNKDYFNQEYIFIKSNFDKIKNKSNGVYNKVVNGDNMFFTKLCCDFKLLEDECLRYELIYEQEIALAEVAVGKVED